MSKSKERKQLRKKRKEQEKRKNAKKSRRIKVPDDPKRFDTFLFDPRNLTTPTVLDEHVLQFCRTINPDETPVFLEVTPEDWCRQGCCILNVKKLVEREGGCVLCGYKIWYHPGFLIEAERHAVHQNSIGQLRDATFTVDGETKILFIRDVESRASDLKANKIKLRMALDHRTKPSLRRIEQSERYNAIAGKDMSDSEAWARMPTYEEFKQGRRQRMFVNRQV